MFNAITGVIRGRVQGVGFRYFVKTKADSLYLTGWVRNLPDGTVEVLVKGPTSDLEQIMHYLRTGPVGSRVESADLQWFREEKDFKAFEIRG